MTRATILCSRTLGRSLEKYNLNTKAYIYTKKKNGHLLSDESNTNAFFMHAQ